MTPFKKLILIFILTLICGYISLPNEFEIFGKKLSRRDVDFNIGRFYIQKEFDLVLGLDLAGGSHLVLEADTSQLPDDKKEDLWVDEAMASTRSIYAAILDKDNKDWLTNKMNVALELTLACAKTVRVTENGLLVSGFGTSTNKRIHCKL